ncbi:MAG: hypothetical protein ABF633_03375 [Clostridium sp.]|uniref:hypothetical protein n=1 Tax=Clostridium sp. TaxID=1506 RepID=UPI0039EB3259
MQINNYTVEHIISLLQNKHKLGESRYYKADLEASNLLMDLDLIIEQSQLTKKQQFIVDHYWIAGYTQEEVASKLDITQQMVVKHCNAVKKKIERVLIDMGELN